MNIDDWVRYSMRQKPAPRLRKPTTKEFLEKLNALTEAAKRTGISAVTHSMTHHTGARVPEFWSEYRTREDTETLTREVMTMFEAAISAECTEPADHCEGKPNV